MIPDRRIEWCPARAESIEVDGQGDPVAWLEEQGKRHQLRWLLAFTDEGVVWGRLDEGRLTTSAEAARGHTDAEAACPQLRIDLLRQARLFGMTGEIFLWQDGDGAWAARLVQDTADPAGADWDEAIDEHTMLVGTAYQILPHDFTLFRDGAQGQWHAVPLRVTPGHAPEDGPRLVVRHYLGREDFARIVASRLVDLR